MRQMAMWMLGATMACADVETPDDHDHDHAHGLVTTVELDFRALSDDSVQTFAWSDPEDDGDPTVDTISLSEGSYVLDVRFINDLEDPAEDVTAEVAEEGEEHQVFLTGSGVQSEATGAQPDALLDVAYDDDDGGGLPLGLAHTVSTLQSGAGELTLTLRHLPPEDGDPVKTADLAADVAAGGFGSLPGDTDVQVTFELEVP